MSYYAEELKDESVPSILNKLSIENDGEAKRFLIFLNNMCDYVLEESKNSVVVLKQAVCTSDAENPVM